MRIKAFNKNPSISFFTENKELHCKHRAPQDQETERTERTIRETQCKQD